MTAPTAVLRGQFRSDFDAHIKAVEQEPGLSSTSPTKYEAFQEWLAGVLGVTAMEVRTAWMGDTGDFTARRGQIASARPRLGVVLVGTGFDRIADRSAGLIYGPTECVVLATKDDGAWTIRKLLATL